MGDTEADAHTLKHGLTEDEIRQAWDTPIACRQRNREDDPPIWIAIGVLPDGRMAELIALENSSGQWVVLHAMTPPTKKFMRELGMRR